MALLSDMLATLVQMEFFQLLFPFLLALAIMYGVLTWALEKQLPKSARGIVSLVFALFVMFYASTTPALYLFITALSGPWLMIACGILFAVVLLGLVGLDIKTFGTKDAWTTKSMVLGLIIVGVFLLFFFNYGNFGINIGGGSDLTGIVVFVAILAIVMYFLTKEEKK